MEFVMWQDIFARMIELLSFLKGYQVSFYFHFLSLYSGSEVWRDLE